MRGIVFDVSLARYALGKALGKQLPSLYWGPLSCLSLREVAEPTLRGPAWAKIAVEAAGFCGSDLATVLLKMSPALTPFSSFPAVLGHEIFGRLAEVGSDAREESLEQYTSMVLEKTLADEAPDGSGWRQHFSSSELTPSLLAPGLRATYVHRAITHGPAPS